MKNYKVLLVGLITTLTVGVAFSAQANENDNHKGQRGGFAPQKGTPVGHNRIIKHADGHEITHAVIGDHRPLATIHNDRTIIRVKLGFSPTGHVEHRWDHWHRD